MTGAVTAGLHGSPPKASPQSAGRHEAPRRGDRLHLVHADEWTTTGSRTADELRKRHPGLKITTHRLSGRPSAALPVQTAKAEMLVIS